MSPQTRMKSSAAPDEKPAAPDEKPDEKKDTKSILEERKNTLSVVGKKIPHEVSQQLRRLAHDLSNAMETVMQASYLLAHANLDENNKKWLSLIDQAARDAARINREIREILRSNSE